MSKSNTFTEKKTRRLYRNAIVREVHALALNSQADYERIYRLMKAWRVVAISQIIAIIILFIVF